MAVVIRLKRVGAKKDAAFRIVVADSRRARDGRFIDQLGYYDPQPRVAQYKVDVEKAKYWLGVGAQASDQVRSLLKKAGVALPSTPKKAKKADNAAPAKKTKGSAKKQASAREVARRLRKREHRADRRTVATKKKAVGAAKPAEAVAAS